MIKPTAPAYTFTVQDRQDAHTAYTAYMTLYAKDKDCIKIKVKGVKLPKGAKWTWVGTRSIDYEIAGDGWQHGVEIKQGMQITFSI